MKKVQKLRSIKIIIIVGATILMSCQHRGVKVNDTRIILKDDFSAIGKYDTLCIDSIYTVSPKDLKERLDVLIITKRVGLWNYYYKDSPVGSIDYNLYNKIYSNIKGDNNVIDTFHQPTHITKEP